MIRSQRQANRIMSAHIRALRSHTTGNRGTGQQRACSLRRALPPRTSGVRALSAAHSLPGPPVTSLMHASACHRTRMHPPAHVPQHTAEHVVGEETGIMLKCFPREKRLKFTFLKKMSGYGLGLTRSFTTWSCLYNIAFAPDDSLQKSICT